MNQTEFFGLPCPSDEDYAALPLYMQRLAEQTEAALIPMRNDLNAALRPPLVIFRNASISGPNPAGGFAQFVMAGPGGDVVFNNYLVPSTGFQPQFGPSGDLFGSAGVYLFIWSMTFTPVGAITAGSWRQAQVTAFADAAGGSQILADMSMRAVENDSLNPGTNLSGQGVFEVGSDFRNAHIAASWSHNNAASNVQISVGGFMCALMRVGGPDIIEVT